jgi:hypothetical protein
MAGKTLTGIGEEETGKLELPDDEPRASEAPSGVTPVSAQPPNGKAAEAAKEKVPARATDRMPLSFGPLTKSGDRVPLSTIIGAPLPILSPDPAVPSIDEDKVAEGLKKLRSLDEPLGSIPSSMPTVKELPAVVEPSAVTPATAAAAAASEHARSRGTAHGHAISPNLLIEVSTPVSVDDRMKGTLLGHMLHLPDVPSSEEPKRTAEVREIARVPSPRTTLLIPPPEDDKPAPAAFRSDARAFDPTPINEEPALENPRSKMVARGAIFLAVTSIFVVAAIAWVRGGKTDSTVIEHPVPPIQPASMENAVAPAPAPPAPSEPAGATVNAPAPAASAPTAAAPTPPPSAPTAAAPTPPPAPAPAEAPPKLEEAKPAHSKSRHHEAASAPAAIASPGAKAAPPPRETTTQSKPVSSANSAVPTKPSTRPSTKPGKAQEDPDGTLPLTE